MKNRYKKYLSIFALALSGGSIYLIPFIKYVFYDQLMGAMNISNTQMGFTLTMYSIGCTLLYIPGGILADRFSAKKSMIASLLGTSALTILFGITLNYALSNVIWLLLAVSTGFVFWSSLMKAIGLIGDDDEKGRMYGIYYAGNGIVGAVVNSLALWTFARFSDPVTGMRMAIFVMAGATIVSAIMVGIFFDEKKKQNTSENKVENTEKFDLSQVKEVIKNPLVWMVSISILCAYTLFTVNSYFTPYLTDVVGISENASSTIAIIRTNLFLVFCAPLGGYIVDKIKSTSKWCIIGNILVAVFFLLLLIIPSNVNSTLLIVLTLIPSAISLMVYGVMFSMVSECKFPSYVTGTVIGIASIIGYLPDFYAHNICGRFLDKFGNGGYTYIFGYLFANCILGTILGVLIRKKLKSQNKEISINK
ncbi:MFS transporter [Tepidibacter aestuarii]|uniref:MFS transporter n=1 Tax=Tepidibacter aestuarii TaxID=2925782 RepID=UPI0020BDB7C1|nr:MFS transporter [Tepidibacter aestuarii]CAH2213798.1 Nitrate/nitrite transporter NarK [Tepidibacter aestuarii]